MGQRVLRIPLLSALSSLLSCLLAVDYPPAVCLIGDVQAQYESSAVDPRYAMGTYRAINPTLTVDEQIVNISAPIYERFHFDDTEDVGPSMYLFKMNTPDGWALTETLPESGVFSTVSLSCLSSSLFDCGRGQWWWGLNTFTYKTEVLKVKDGECSGVMCLRNLTLQLSGDGVKKLDGEYLRSWDNETNRYQWQYESSNLRWFYRVKSHSQGKSYNWVLVENNVDRVACAPAYVETPLFCTQFVYAGGYMDDNGAYISLNPTLQVNTFGIPSWAAQEGDVVTTFRAGFCSDTEEPTPGPTTGPTTNPTALTLAPSINPTTLTGVPTTPPTSNGPTVGPSTPPTSNEATHESTPDTTTVATSMAEMDPHQSDGDFLVVYIAAM
eukprot:157435_1